MIEEFIESWEETADAGGAAAETMEMWKLIEDRLETAVVQYEADREEDVKRLQDMMKRLKPIPKESFGFAISKEDSVQFEWDLDIEMKDALKMAVVLKRFDTEIEEAYVRSREIQGGLPRILDRQDELMREAIHFTEKMYERNLESLSLSEEIDHKEIMLKYPEKLVAFVDFDEKVKEENKRHAQRNKEINDDYSRVKATQETTISKIQKHIDACNATIREMDKKVSASDSEIAKLNTEISKKEAQLKRLDHTGEVKQFDQRSGSLSVSTKHCWRDRRIRILGRAVGAREDIHDEYGTTRIFDFSAGFPVMRVEKHGAGDG